MLAVTDVHGSVQTFPEGSYEFRIRLLGERRKIFGFCLGRHIFIVHIPVEQREKLIVATGHPQCLRLAQHCRGKIPVQRKRLVIIGHSQGIFIHRHPVIPQSREYHRRGIFAVVLFQALVTFLGALGGHQQTETVNRRAFRDPENLFNFIQY